MKNQRNEEKLQKIKGLDYILNSPMYETTHYLYLLFKIHCFPLLVENKHMVRELRKEYHFKI